MTSKHHDTADGIKRIKCVVWDLDNTIWQGTLAENDQVQMMDGVMDVIKGLDERGILNTIASRNNYDDAFEKLVAFGIAEYFLYPQIHWGRKSDSVKIIKEKLNIGYDAIAFIDDQEFERQEVLFEHPSIRCYFPEVINTLLTLEAFNVRFVTSETSQRRLMYQLDQQRNQEEANYINNFEFLKSLNMKLMISKATHDDLKRIEELTIRTHQLNATGYTYSYEELEEMLANDSLQIFVAELQDKFGTYGKIGVSLLDCTNPDWCIKLLLMSCRVMNRGIGSVLLGFLIEYAASKGHAIHAEFLPTDRNRVMYITYRFSGLHEISTSANGVILLKHDASTKPTFPEYIQLSTSNI